MSEVTLRVGHQMEMPQWVCTSVATAFSDIFSLKLKAIFTSKMSAFKSNARGLEPHLSPVHTDQQLQSTYLVTVPSNISSVGNDQS